MSTTTNLSDPPSSPQWDQIDEAIRCPLCDYDLRGLIESRCPECGFKFEWPDLLDPARRRHPFIFEHHPERNIWSAWKTCTAMLRPRKFWSSLHPSQPSRPWRLLSYWFIPVASAMLLVAPIAAWGTFLEVRSEAAQLAGARVQEIAFWKAAAVSQSPDPRLRNQALEYIKRYGSIDNFVNQAFKTPSTYSWSLRRTCGFLIEGLPLAILVIGWPWITILSLMVFSISMRRRRLRNSHVMRTVIYSYDVLGLLGVVCVAPALISFVSRTRYISGALLVGTWLTILVVTVTFFIYRLTIAYKQYLQFDHPFLTVLASQVITLLCMLVILLLPTLLAS